MPAHLSRCRSTPRVRRRACSPRLTPRARRWQAMVSQLAAPPRVGQGEPRATGARAGRGPEQERGDQRPRATRVTESGKASRGPREHAQAGCPSKRGATSDRPPRASPSRARRTGRSRASEAPPDGMSKRGARGSPRRAGKRRAMRRPPPSRKRGATFWKIYGKSVGEGRVKAEIRWGDGPDGLGTNPLLA